MYDKNKDNYKKYCQKIIELKFIDHLYNFEILSNGDFNKYLQDNKQLEHVKQVRNFYCDYILRQIKYIGNEDYDLKIESSFEFVFPKIFHNQVSAPIFGDSFPSFIAEDYYTLTKYCLGIDTQNKEHFMQKCLDKLNAYQNTKNIANYFYKCIQNDIQQTNNNLNNEYTSIVEASDNLQQKFVLQIKQGQTKTTKENTGRENTHQL